MSSTTRVGFLLATRAAVLEASTKLNYRPSAIARSLSTRRTHTVGVVVADVLNPFFASIIRGVEDGLWREGHSLMVCSTDEQAEKEAYYLRLLLERRVDGILIAPTGDPQPVYAELQHHHIPLVFVDRRPPEPYGPVVETDNVEAGYLATNHLLNWGHRRIALVARQPKLSTVIGRTEGYCCALTEFGFQEIDRQIVSVDSTQGAAYAAALALLDDAERPTAIIAANHVMTLGVMSAIQTLKLRCPEEISVVAFDDLPWLALFLPPLTAVRHALAEICSISVDLLLGAFGDAELEANGSIRLGRRSCVSQRDAAAHVDSPPQLPALEMKCNHWDAKQHLEASLLRLSSCPLRPLWLGGLLVSFVPLRLGGYRARAN